MAKAVLAGNCFRGVEAACERLRGAAAVASYAGGQAADANYEKVGAGRTGEAESVTITYGPSQQVAQHPQFPGLVKQP